MTCIWLHVADWQIGNHIQSEQCAIRGIGCRCVENHWPIYFNWLKITCWNGCGLLLFSQQCLSRGKKRKFDGLADMAEPTLCWCKSVQRHSCACRRTGAQASDSPFETLASGVLSDVYHCTKVDEFVTWCQDRVNQRKFATISRWCAREKRISVHEGNTQCPTITGK